VLPTSRRGLGEDDGGGEGELGELMAQAGVRDEIKRLVEDLIAEIAPEADR
jgi:hypothetical protein